MRQQVINDPITGIDFSIRYVKIDRPEVPEMRYDIEYVKLVDNYSRRCQALRRKLKARWKR